jgi:hypothetical protein
VNTRNVRDHLAFLLVSLLLGGQIPASITLITVAALSPPDHRAAPADAQAPAPKATAPAEVSEETPTAPPTGPSPWSSCAASTYPTPAAQSEAADADTGRAAAAFRARRPAGRTGSRAVGTGPAKHS